MYLGLDPSSSEKKPSGCALLDRSGHLSLVRRVTADADILELVKRMRPNVVAIDAPLFYPRGWDCLEWPCQAGVCPSPPWTLRAAERELYRQGIPLYATTKKSFIKALIYRAVDLKKEIEALGLAVIEIYPYASKVRLFGRPIPKKTTRVGRGWLQRRLEELIPGLSLAELLSHDELDAIVAAYTAYLDVNGQAIRLGDPEEGVIITPA